ncbi:tRNA (guanosine(46)-N7)-methyltransferase TrmB [Pontixanthobacter aestiaquae]|uniref:tRNA (guanine-N(7)-)-methyltransferase n=1 Tax=Pontixanthobacter aestiaquae TaxID=1509367 RepID=A0A844Z2K8_9SPHN|nr:tRNA (guanosine(46)-N7)-methyltransferase TrmB [Pontixanthobacter aestiaquae]MDN3647116.1 tRNA (guanosine(46)-N7)-methyltransferase TrmB [Pontixanthobacter aestiaquae]MXO81908.1 tRNA (guanosine(46)-N7)-methyltransferase TrmB [Pontixanthobacter aestiaquae]
MTAHKPGDPTTLNRLYGRSQGKPLRASQQDLVENFLPKIAVPLEGDITSQGLFGDDRPMHFEIGFGSGEHMADRADMLPDHGFIGAEPFLNGVAGALTHAKERGLANIRIHHGDALQVLARIPDGALSFVYLLHPDPWPKARHAKRRMMNDGPVQMIAAKLKKGGEFRFGTDHDIYLRHALMVMRRHTDEFEWLAESPADWQNRPAGWSETRYERKAREVFGHEVWYFRYRRK